MDQWKSGNCCELKFVCENGQLQVNMSVNFGEWKIPTKDTLSEADSRGYQGLRKASPSRHRRNMRRAAARAGTSADAKKAAAASEKNAAEKVAAEKTAAAEKAASAAEKNYY